MYRYVSNEYICRHKNTNSLIVHIYIGSRLLKLLMVQLKNRQNRRIDQDKRKLNSEKNWNAIALLFKKLSQVFTFHGQKWRQKFISIKSSSFSAMELKSFKQFHKKFNRIIFFQNLVRLILRTILCQFQRVLSGPQCTPTVQHDLLPFDILYKNAKKNTWSRIWILQMAQ